MCYIEDRGESLMKGSKLESRTISTEHGDDPKEENISCQEIE